MVCLVYVYNKVVDYLSENMKELRQDHIEARVKEEFSKCKDLPITADNIMVHVKCFDSYGNEIKPNIFQDSNDFTNYNVCVLRIQLKNITSIVQTDKNVGSLVFCETFYIQSGFYNLLTAGVPYINSWLIQAKFSDAIEKTKDAFICPELGKSLTEPYDNNYIYIPPKEVFSSERELISLLFL